MGAQLSRHPRPHPGAPPSARPHHCRATLTPACPPRRGPPQLMCVLPARSAKAALPYCLARLVQEAQRLDAPDESTTSAGRHAQREAELAAALRQEGDADADISEDEDELGRAESWGSDAGGAAGGGGSSSVSALAARLAAVFPSELASLVDLTGLEP